MTIKIRPITSEESKILDHWQRADNVVGYRRARILRLAEAEDIRSWNQAPPPFPLPERELAVYATLDDETQEAFFSWAEGQPNSEVTVESLEALMRYWTQKGKRFIALFWDKASWHTSHRTRGWIREYNRCAKRGGLTRLFVCYLPTRSPWLMPLEAVFGWMKHDVLGDRSFETVAEL